MAAPIPPPAPGGVPADAPAPRAAAPASNLPAASARAEDRLVHVASFRDPAAQGDRVKELYERLAEAKRAAGEPVVLYDCVEALVRAQVSKLKAEGHDVAFRVAVKDGKVSLTVKPVKEE